MDTVITPTQETKGQQQVPETEKQQFQGGTQIIHGVAHVNPLVLQNLDPYDLMYPIGS